MASCFHCALPVPRGAQFRAAVLGAEREFCCAGCRAVAQAIAEGGFARYYETRTEPANRPAAQAVAPAAPAVSGNEAALVLEGVRCSACLWLIEAALRRVPGVLRADVNYTTQRALVRWDPARTGLDAVVAAVAAVGYGAAPYEPARQAAAELREGRTALLRLFVAAFGAMQVMMYAFPAYVGGDELSADAAVLMRWAGLLLTTPVLLFSCAPFFRGAWGELRARRPGLETPIALGLASAYAASAWATLAGQGEVYFDSVSMLAFLLLAARYAQSALRRRALRVLDPLLRPAAMSNIAAGDRILVAPGERFPADGVVLEGASSADESLLSGESRPVAKRAGDEVVAGAVNLDQPLAVRATRVGADTRAAGIARLVERAATDRPALVDAADRIARPLTLAVLAIAAAAWHFSGSPWTAVAVLVVTCPCALALASPVVLMRAGATLLSRGVLVTRSRVFQSLDRVTDVLVDKTGTLTEGRLRVSRIRLLGAVAEKDVLDVAGALEGSSRHPIARAFPPSALPVREPRYVPGCGIEGEVGGRVYRMGSAAFCGLADAPAGDTTQVCLADAGGVLAVFELEDRLRPDAALLVQRLAQRGLRVHLVSGDRAPAVAAVARAVGIERATGDLKPEDKLARIRALQADGRVVAMIGDGLNDGPVLAAADASITLGSAADATQLQADAVLLRDSLLQVEDLLETSRATLRIVRQSIGWALAYNALAVPAAALGLVGPLEAALGMGASSIAVLLNALRPLQGASRKPGWKASTSSSPSRSPSFS